MAGLFGFKMKDSKQQSKSLPVWRVKNIRMREQSREGPFWQECVGSALHTALLTSHWVTAEMRQEYGSPLDPRTSALGWEIHTFFAWVPLARQRKCIAQHLFRNIWSLESIQPRGTISPRTCIQMSVTSWDLAGTEASCRGLLPLRSVGEAVIVRPLGSRIQELRILMPH